MARPRGRKFIISLTQRMEPALQVRLTCAFICDTVSGKALVVKKDCKRGFQSDNTALTKILPDES